MSSSDRLDKFALIGVGLLLLNLSCTHGPRGTPPPEAYVAALAPGMPRCEAERRIHELRPGAPFYWDDLATATFDRYQLGSGRALVLSYAEPHDALHGSPDDVLHATRVNDADALAAKVPAALMPAVRLIHQAPSPKGRCFDPVAMVQTVNGLRKLGKAAALAGLRHYAGMGEAMAANGDDIVNDVDVERVFLIARLLFVRRDGRSKMPQMSWMMVGAQRTPTVNEVQGDWPLFPLVLVDDLPFDISWGHTADAIRSPTEDLDYCEQNCEIRAQPLAPKGSPVVIAERLLRSRQWSDFFRTRPPEGRDVAQELIRVQALRCAGEMPGKRETWIEPELTDQMWRNWVDDVRLRAMRWDGQRSVFVCCSSASPS